MEGNVRVELASRLFSIVKVIKIKYTLFLNQMCKTL